MRPPQRSARARGRPGRSCPRRKNRARVGRSWGYPSAVALFPTQRARGHHTVPRWHIAEFGVPRGTDTASVVAFSKVSDRFLPRPLPARVATVRTDYYTVEDRGQPSDELERALANVDGKAKAVVSAIAAAPAGALLLPPEDREALALYLALLSYRAPSIRVRVETALAAFATAEILARIRDEPDFPQVARRFGRGGTDDELLAWREEIVISLQEGKTTIRAPIPSSLPVIGQGIKVTPLIAGMRWTALRLSRRPWFVLGDNPMVVCRPADLAPGEPAEGRGWFVVPLTADTAVIGDHLNGPDTVRESDLPVGDLLGQVGVPLLPHIPVDPAGFCGMTQWMTSERWVFGTAREDLMPGYRAAGRQRTLAGGTAAALRLAPGMVRLLQQRETMRKGKSPP